MTSRNAKKWQKRQILLKIRWSPEDNSSRAITRRNALNDARVGHCDSLHSGDPLWIIQPLNKLALARKDVDGVLHVANLVEVRWLSLTTPRIMPVHIR